MNSLIQNFVGFEGRFNRQPFWISGVILAAVSIVVALIILPLLGLTMMPTLNLGPGTTASEIAAVMSEATVKSRWASLIMFVIFLYPAAAICIKRRHDRGNSGLDVWIYFVVSGIYVLLQALGIGMTTVEYGGAPFPAPTMPMMLLGLVVGLLGLYLLVVLGFLRGSPGTNAYGPDPLGG